MFRQFGIGGEENGEGSQAGSSCLFQFTNYMCLQSGSFFPSISSEMSAAFLNICIKIDRTVRIQTQKLYYFLGPESSKVTQLKF